MSVNRNFTQYECLNCDWVGILTDKDHGKHHGWFCCPKCDKGCVVKGNKEKTLLINKRLREITENINNLFREQQKLQIQYGKYTQVKSYDHCYKCGAEGEHGTFFAIKEDFGVDHWGKPLVHWNYYCPKCNHLVDTQEVYCPEY